MSQKNTLAWGILSTAKIAREKLIPAINASSTSKIIACASRDQQQADAFALQTNIGKAYGSYQQLLDDPNIDVIYNPLPNHLHVPWTLKALEAGKHVLCEKPVGLNVGEVEQLIQGANNYPHLKVMEAFMYRFHPQWALAKQQLSEGKIGKIHSIEAMFSYHNVDPNNVRNMPNIGGGGLMDIGCYCISATRFLLAKEPVSVMGKLTIDENFTTDKHASVLLDFGDLRTSFYCSTQSEPGQRVFVAGEHGSLTIEQPFYQANNGATQLIWQHNNTKSMQTIEGCDHYVKQVDAFAAAIQNQQVVPTPLTDALANMKVIEAIFTSDKENRWVNV